MLPDPPAHDATGGDRHATASLPPPELSLAIDHDPRIQWAMEQNGIPLVHSVRVTNTGAAALLDLVLSLQVAPDLSERFEARLPSLAPGETWNVERPDIRLDGGRLAGRREREQGALQVEVRDGGRLLFQESRPVAVLAANEWERGSIPELLAAFVLPNHPAVARLLETARDLLGAATGDPALDGYQRGTRERVRAVAEAAHGAVGRLGITYSSPPASFEPGGQKVRFPGEVLEHRMGTCIDLTVLLAAALEQCGLNPALVLARGHAFAGVWLIDDWLPVASTDEEEVARKLAAAGELLLFDAASAAAAPAAPFAAAEKLALEHLARPGAFEHLVDVRAARLARILPLPVAAPAAAAGIETAAAPGAGGAAVTSRGAAPAVRLPPARGPVTRLDVWKERLLDLSLRSRLINFKESRHTTVALAVPELDLLEDQLAAGRRLRLEPRVETAGEAQRSDDLLAGRGAEERLRAERLALLEKGRILTRHARDDLDQRLLATFRQARVELEETGGSTLCLALGMLRWFESPASDVPRLAPILLYPVKLSRQSAELRFEMELRDDEPRLNDALLEKLRIDFGLDFPELRTLPQDEAGADMRAVLGVLRRAIARVPRFEVLDEARLAFFSFAKFLLWRDLHEAEDDLLKNDLVRHLAAGEGAADFAAGDFLDPRRLDHEAPPSRSRLVLDADSSQHVAVDAALKGKSFVLQGPPGTGKSQTIANIVAECLAAGKRVLFVAEKRAALEVVARRLRAVGLGDWCLELHSQKAQKREVVLALARSLDAGSAAPPAPAPARARSGAARAGPAPEDAAAVTARLGEQVEAAAARLNAYVDRLHAPTPLGPSHFQCAARLLALEGAPGAEGAAFPGALATGAGTHAGRLESLRRLALAAGDAGDVATHPFGACRVVEWTPLRAREWEAGIRALLEAGLAASEAAGAVVSLAGLPSRLSVAALPAAAEIALLLGEDVPEGAAALLARPDAEATIGRLAAAVRLLEEHRALRRKLAERYHDALHALDLPALLARYRRHASSFVLFRWLALRRAKAAVRAAARGPLPGAAAILADLEAAARAAELAAAFGRERPFLADVLGAEVPGAEVLAAGTGIDILARLVSFARRWREAAARLSSSPSPAVAGTSARPEPQAAREAGARLREAYSALRRELERATASLGLDRARAFGAAGEGFPPDAAAARAAAWLQAMPALRPWARFVVAEDEARAAGLEVFIAALRSARLQPGDLAAAYERAFLRAWVEESFETHPELRAFHGREHDRTAASFRELDRDLIAAGGAAVAALLEPRRPAAGGEAAPDSEVGILRREALKKARHLPIRRLLERIPNLLPRLKPCLLMSPLSIAQYLPPSRQPFDLVIFDEASQIPTHDAIGAVARGRQVIVVGDSKQLPPTQFFAYSFEEEDDEEPAAGPAGAAEEELAPELESILDECIASSVPALLLRWHYRSRDERLIAFSNRHYYDDRLHTFPAAAGAGARGLGVSLLRVEGRFDRGKSRTNPAEAEAAARWVTEALLDPERRARSIGVVTFNQPQQSLVEDLLDAARREHPEIEPYFSDRAPEPVFVKNLENVQGDERDVILFSVTYGADAGGRVSMNFGPLNRQGGERRLNVAITRAREELVVFSTLRPDEIDLSRTRALGAEHLKSFLRYAELGPAVLGASSGTGGGEEALSAFEDDVARRLREHGHAVDVRVGCSAYRLDLAVRDPGSPDRFLLGIEGDGASYREAATARDRDRLRQAVLESLGWRTHRIWSADWLGDREAEIRRLEEAVAAARGAAPARARGANRDLAPARERRAPGAAPVPGAGPPTSPAVAPVPAPRPARERGTKPREPASRTAGRSRDDLPLYKPFVVKPRGTMEAFKDARREREILDLIQEIVEAEGPLHRDLLWRRVVGCYDIGQIGRHIRERLEALTARAASEGRLRLAGAFAWPARLEPSGFRLVRVPPPDGAPAREIGDVPPEELANAAEIVLRDGVALPREALMRGAAEVLGYRRLTDKMRASFAAAIDLLAAAGRCAVDGETVRLRD